MEDTVHEELSASVSVCHSVVVMPCMGGQPVITMLWPEQVEIVVVVELFTATETGKIFLAQRLNTSVAVT